MNRYRYRRRRRDSLGYVVNDSAYIAAKFGPIGALITGTVGFVVFYAILPMLMIVQMDANKAKFVGPATALLEKIFDQMMWQRFITPCQSVGIAILLACWAIAAWKVFSIEKMSNSDIGEMSWLAKFLAHLLR